jgi:hypothetical protein
VSGGSWDRGIGGSAASTPFRPLDPPLPRSPAPPLPWLLLLAAVWLLLPACAYYNGMYNARRFAKQAERSERLGRMSEARERWRRAAMHAESLVVRHPGSRWVDDALLVRGRALVHTEQFMDAVLTLERAVRVATTTELREDALLLLGRASLALRRYPQAESTLVLASGSARAQVRDEAYWYLGRALNARGEPRRALEVLGQTTARDAATDRLRAALALDDAAALHLAADDLHRARYREAPWRVLLDSLELAGYGELVGEITAALLARDDVTSGEKARLHLAAAHLDQLRGHDSRARSRLEAVRALVPDSAEARVAETRLLLLEARAAESDTILERMRAPLLRIALLGGLPGEDARTVIELLDRLAALAAAGDHADARLFLRAELLRDSLGARRLAAAAWSAIADLHPGSPWAPKALLAAVEAGHGDSEALLERLMARYESSPYVAAALGDEAGAAAYARLEDSLRVTLAAVGGRRGGVPADPAAPRPGPDRVPARPPAGRPRIDP